MGGCPLTRNGWVTHARKAIEGLDSGRLSLGSLKHRHGAGGRPHPTAVARDRPKGWESKAPGPGACA